MLCEFNECFDSCGYILVRNVLQCLLWRYPAILDLLSSIQYDFTIRIERLIIYAKMLCLFVSAEEMECSEWCDKANGDSQLFFGFS
jgi:hypothetical protein